MAYKRVPVKNYADDGQTTELFRVTNTNENGIYVLAVDADAAASMAQGSHHVRDIANARVSRVDLNILARHKPHFVSSLKRALKERIQGVAQDKSGYAIIRDKIYMPLSEV